MAAVEETLQEKFIRVIAEAQRLMVEMRTRKINSTEEYRQLENYLAIIKVMNLNGNLNLFSGDNKEKLINNIGVACDNCNQILSPKNDKLGNRK